MPESMDVAKPTTGPGSLDRLQGWLRLRGRTEAELRDWLAGELLQVEAGVAYQGLEGVVHLHNPSVSSVHLYCREGRLRLLYVSDPAALQGLDPQTLTHRLGAGAQTLASRAGPDARLVVHPAAGVAWSMGRRGLHFLEVFPPTTLERYRQVIYREPSRFRR